MARKGRHRTLARGETLFTAGETQATCATLVRGALKVAALDADGTEHILALVHPAGFVGELFTAYSGHDVVALGEAEVCLFRADTIEEATEDHPELARALLRRAQEDLYASRELLALNARKSARAKVAGLLMALARSASGSPCHPASRFDLPLKRSDIAAMLGLTIETVSRQIGALEKDGLIVRHGRSGIELVDPAGLVTATA